MNKYLISISWIRLTLIPTMLPFKRCHKVKLILNDGRVRFRHNLSLSGSLVSILWLVPQNWEHCRWILYVLGGQSNLRQQWGVKPFPSLTSNGWYPSCSDVTWLPFSSVCPGCSSDWCMTSPAWLQVQNLHRIITDPNPYYWRCSINLLFK